MMKEWTGAANSQDAAVAKGLKALRLSREQVFVEVLSEKPSSLLSMMGFTRVQVKLTVRPEAARGSGASTRREDRSAYSFEKPYGQDRRREGGRRETAGRRRESRNQGSNRGQEISRDRDRRQDNFRGKGGDRRGFQRQERPATGKPPFEKPPARMPAPPERKPMDAPSAQPAAGAAPAPMDEARRERLTAQAMAAAEEAKKNRRPFRLDPMPPADRKLIHQVLAGHPDVETVSEGDGPFRKVVVRPKNSSGGIVIKTFGAGGRTASPSARPSGEASPPSPQETTHS